jgi:hypothetical protein
MMLSALIMVASITRRNQVEEKLKSHNESLQKRVPVFEDRLTDRIEAQEIKY